jgi:transcriptional regulator with XRE-family HTH domain
MLDRPRGPLWLQRSYNFVNKNPKVDALRTAWQGEHITEDQLAALAGCAKSTVKNLFGGKTISPQYNTLVKLAGAMGKKFELVDDRKPDYEKEIPVAIEQRKEYRRYLQRKRERIASRPKKRKAA